MQHLRNESAWGVLSGYLAQVSGNSVVLVVAAVFWPTSSSKQKSPSCEELPKLTCNL